MVMYNMYLIFTQYTKIQTNTKNFLLNFEFSVLFCFYVFKMDVSNSSQMLISQIFGSQQNLDEQNGAHFLSGNRNQYREIARFDTEEELGEWIGLQGKKWGIVQKGRVTIEDIIDQYACVYRRRKGYSCKVQMRVRHNRRTGHKVVEVLELEHDHTFYGYKSCGSDLGDVKPFGAPPFPTPSSSASNNNFGRSSANYHSDDRNGDSSTMFGNGMMKQEEFDLGALLRSVGGGDDEFRHSLPSNSMDDLHHHQQNDNVDGDHHQLQQISPLNNQQPMEMLLSNILNNATAYSNGIDDEAKEIAEQQQQQNGGNGDDQEEEEEEEDGYGDRGVGEGVGARGSVDFVDDEGGFEMEGGTDLMGGMGQMLLAGQQHEELAQRVAEKMADLVASQFEPKFASIMTTLNSLTKSVDELKRAVTVQKQIAQPQHSQQQHQQKRRFVPISPATTTSSSLAREKNASTSSSLNVKQNANNIGNHVSSSSSKIAFKPYPIPQVRSSTQQQQQQHPPPPKLSRADIPVFKPANQKQQNNNIEDIKMAMFGNKQIQMIKVPMTNVSNKNKQQQQQSTCSTTASATALSQSIHWASAKPQQQLSSVNLSNLNSYSDGSALLVAPRRSPRKSLYAYRQRRRELSYRHMKEIGLTLIINGIPKSIFHCRVSDIALAVEAKRKELANSHNKVIYRGKDVTDKLYRVDCCRTLVNGRRCGQMIADSLWPRGFFRTRMLMPILRGVSHRTKRRVDGTMRAAVSDDQFEVFKEALIRLGGFLMDEQDRFKWMETAREGVNQRGLDELANSKRAHFDFEGGPLFSDEHSDLCLANVEGQNQRPSVTVFTSSVTALPESIWKRKSNLPTNDDDEIVIDGEEDNNMEDYGDEEEDALLLEEEEEEEDDEERGGRGGEQEE